MTEIVAELSANHLGDQARMFHLIAEAKAAGADAVKIQLWSPQHMVRDLDYRLPDGPWAGYRLADLYEKTATLWGWVPKIMDVARAAGIKVIASVFDEPSLEHMERHGCERYKIASLEITDLRLIRAVARTEKPVIISTGGARLTEIYSAVRAAQGADVLDLTLLRCTAGYPSTRSEARLACLEDLHERFNCKVGVSDHSRDRAVWWTTLALDAHMLEVHFTLARDDGGPDSHFSVEPHELREITQMRRHIDEALGTADYEPQASERTQLKLRRGVYATRLLLPGATIRDEDIATARPQLGLGADVLDALVGRKVVKQIAANAPITADQVD
ncbi:MAG TPA: N-acetylneuraminate synthase family protein [Gemmatimonadales bacterium]